MSASRSGMVRIRDVHKILAIVNGLYELPDDPNLRMTQLMNEVCRFFGARSGMAAILDPRPRDGAGHIVAGAAGGWLDDTMIRLYERYAHEAHLRDLMLSRILVRPRPVGVHTRSAQVADRTWYRSPHFNEMRIPLGIDDSIYAFWAFPGTRFLAGVGFNRELGGRKFTLRETRLAGLMHEALVPFYRYLQRSFSAHLNPRLTPRGRDVYQGLIRGRSEKEIAALLGISPNTVHEYVQRVYAAFDVSSRAELMARVMQDGGTCGAE